MSTPVLSELRGLRSNGLGVYAYYSSGGLGFVEIDPSDGSTITDKSITGISASLNNDLVAVSNDTYFVLDTAGANLFKIVLGQSGLSISATTIVLSTTIDKGLHFYGSSLYGLRFDGVTTWYLTEIDINTGAVTDVTTLTGVSSTYEGRSTILDGKYVAILSKGLTQKHLMVIDLTSYAVEVDVTLYGDETEVIWLESYQSTLYGVRWTGTQTVLVSMKTNGSITQVGVFANIAEIPVVNQQPKTVHNGEYIGVMTDTNTQDVWVVQSLPVGAVVPTQEPVFAMSAPLIAPLRIAEDLGAYNISVGVPVSATAIFINGTAVAYDTSLCLPINAELTGDLLGVDPITSVLTITAAMSAITINLGTSTLEWPIIVYDPIVAEIQVELDSTTDYPRARLVGASLDSGWLDQAWAVCSTLTTTAIALRKTGDTFITYGPDADNDTFENYIDEDDNDPLIAPGNVDLLTMPIYDTVQLSVFVSNNIRLGARYDLNVTGPTHLIQPGLSVDNTVESAAAWNLPISATTAPNTGIIIGGSTEEARFCVKECTSTLLDYIYPGLLPGADIRIRYKFRRGQVTNGGVNPELVGEFITPLSTQDEAFVATRVPIN